MLLYEQNFPILIKSNQCKISPLYGQIKAILEKQRDKRENESSFDSKKDK